MTHRPGTRCWSQWPPSPLHLSSRTPSHPALAAPIFAHLFACWSLQIARSDGDGSNVCRASGSIEDQATAWHVGTEETRVGGARVEKGHAVWRRSMSQAGRPIAGDATRDAKPFEYPSRGRRVIDREPRGGLADGRQGCTGSQPPNGNHGRRTWERSQAACAWMVFTRVLHGREMRRPASCGV